MGNFVPFLSSLQEEEMNVSRFEVWITGFETQCKKHEGKWQPDVRTGTNRAMTIGEYEGEWKMSLLKK